MAETAVNHADKTLEIGAAAGILSAVALRQGFNLDLDDSALIGAFAAAAGWGVGRSIGKFMESNFLGMAVSGALAAIPAGMVIYHGVL
ncbi:MAG: hypothetical protein GC136_08040 [Alphaproteobacteria bacterium]|nr:hypothetical protein [Alphaproteobacteria bacterium]